jgi:hypothetical protein
MSQGCRTCGYDQHVQLLPPPTPFVLRNFEPVPIDLVLYRCCKLSSWRGPAATCSVEIRQITAQLQCVASVDFVPTEQFTVFSYTMSHLASQQNSRNHRKFRVARIVGVPSTCFIVRESPPPCCQLKPSRFETILKRNTELHILYKLRYNNFISRNKIPNTDDTVQTFTLHLNYVTPATKLERTKNIHVFTEVYTVETYIIPMLYKISLSSFEHFQTS